MVLLRITSTHTTLTDRVWSPKFLEKENDYKKLAYHVSVAAAVPFVFSYDMFMSLKSKPQRTKENFFNRSINFIKSNKILTISLVAFSIIKLIDFSKYLERIRISKEINSFDNQYLSLLCDKSTFELTKSKKPHSANVGILKCQIKKTFELANKTKNFIKTLEDKLERSHCYDASFYYTHLVRSKCHNNASFFYSKIETLKYFGNALWIHIFKISSSIDSLEQK